MNIYKQLGADLAPDTSLTQKPISIAETYRQQLKIIAQGIDVNINNLLNLATTDQLLGIVELHQDIPFCDPDGSLPMSLSGITLKVDNEVKEATWMLSFVALGFGTPAGTYRLHDLEIADVMGLLETVERIMAP